MMKKKIVYIMSDGNRAGGVRHVYNLIQNLKDEFEITIIIPQGEFLQDLNNFDNAIKLINCEMRLRSISRLRSILSQFDKDTIFHFEGIKAGIWGRIAAIFLPNRKLYTEHNLTQDYRIKSIIKGNLQKILIAILNRSSDAVICVSSAVYDYYKAKNLAPLDKMKLIYNGVQFYDIDSKTYHDNEIFRIGTGTSLTKRKRIDDVIKSINNIDNIELLILGSGEEENNLKNLVKKQGLENKVKFLGTQSNPRNFYDQIHLFVQASKDESFGMAVVEAMGSGVPVAISNIYGLNDVTPNYVKRFESGNVDSINKTIRAIQADYDAYLALFKDKDFTRTEFSIESMVIRHKELYLNLVV